MFTSGWNFYVDTHRTASPVGGDVTGTVGVNWNVLGKGLGLGR